MEQARKVLTETFGLPSFRLSQEPAIQRLLVDNENTLVVFPTGGGKSLTYQVPALCLEGLTLVVSPLLSLMKDQVDALVQAGVKAASLDSTLTRERAAWVKDEVLSGSLKILYVSPERLNNEAFLAMMRRINISLLAVDESHCISQWGASFRPDYLKIARFAEEFDVPRVVCLTATATKKVVEDICTGFHIDKEAGVFRAPVYRPNLAFQVQVAQTADEKLKHLVPLLQSRTGPAIVYVTLQKQAEEIADILCSHGLMATAYHAGLPSEERERVQTDFMQSENGIVCATIAFGMGIDKANIRHVVHYHAPKTLENYSQEVGRAGRDGLESTCLMFLSSDDIPVLEGFARGDTCAKRDLELWLQEIALQEPALDGTLAFNHYQQSKTYDIKPTFLNQCYAQLELHHKYLRAVTPFYSVYEISARTDDGWAMVLEDRSPAATAIREHWKCNRKGDTYKIDVVTAAEYSKIDRAEIARQVSNWQIDGCISVKASQVRARYQILNPLPKTTAGIQELANELYERMLDREQEAVAKLRQVIRFATNDNCFANAISSYFGDEDTVLLCGKCSFCTTGTGIEFTPQTESVPDPEQLQAILQACPERDDPRLLARMAFGITSPRLRAGKWSTSHPLFGSMVSVDFNALVAAFDKECQKVGYANSQSHTSTSALRTMQKRSYTQSAYFARGSSSSRGGAPKALFSTHAWPALAQYVRPLPATLGFETRAKVPMPPYHGFMGNWTRHLHRLMRWSHI
ncbi:ATP-dependent DNA helicase [Laetiporus sulphureus 93-53]|uniref:ATP-dependent DNA helicase n=1 Tax=Laetiporus sulphureus 93-53 TaxID=1314785 RepID=A0A165E0J0_9APHY|nr:ATP-dependent DNA helicase [Laetiporus sulphureus 93-53]KZT06011.1 ATP-dependent DNA helicase [Laetiporus sulphureus 93-53]